MLKPTSHALTQRRFVQILEYLPNMDSRWPRRVTPTCTMAFVRCVHARRRPVTAGSGDRATIGVREACGSTWPATGKLRLISSLAGAAPRLPADGGSPASPSGSLPGMCHVEGSDRSGAGQGAITHLPRSEYGGGGAIVRKDDIHFTGIHSLPDGQIYSQRCRRNWSRRLQPDTEQSRRRRL